MYIGEREFKLLVTMQNRTQRELDSINRQLKSTEQSGRQAESAVRGLGTALKTLFVGGLIASVFQFSAGLESTKTSIQTMLGSAKAGNAVFEQWKTMSAQTPLQFDDVARTGQALLAYGESASTVTETIRMLGDVSMGNAEKMGRVSSAYGQMMTVGKGNLEDIKRIAEAGIPIFDALSKQMDVSRPALMKLISEGKVGFKDVQKAMQSMTAEGGKFKDMMLRISKTPAGMFSTLVDNIKMAGSTIMTALFPPIMEVFEALTNLFGEMDGSLRLFGQGLALILMPVAKLINLLAKGLASAHPAIKVMITMLVGAGGLYWAFMKVYTAIKLIAAGITVAKAIAYAEVVAIIAAIAAGIAIFGAIIGAWVNGWQKMSSSIATWANGMKNIFSGLIDIMVAPFQAIGGFVKEVFLGIVDTIRIAFAKVVMSGASAINSLLAAARKIPGLGNLRDVSVSADMQALAAQDISSAFSQRMRNAQGEVERSWTKQEEGIQKVIDGTKQALEGTMGAYEGFYGGLKETWQQVKGYFSKLSIFDDSDLAALDGIIPAFDDAGNAAGKAAADQFKKGMREARNWLESTQMMNWMTGVQTKNNTDRSAEENQKAAYFAELMSVAASKLNMPKTSSMMQGAASSLASSGGSPQMAVVQVILSAIMDAMQKAQSLVDVLNPVLTITQAFVDTLAPALDGIFYPMSAMLKLIGAYLAQMLIPIMMLLCPIIEMLGRIFVWFYNGVMVPFHNGLRFVFNRIQNTIADMLNNVIAILNKAIRALNKLPKVSISEIGYIDHVAQDSGFLNPITWSDLQKPADTAAGTANSASYAAGTHVTVNITINTDVIAGESGIRELAIMLRDEIHEAEALGL